MKTTQGRARQSRSDGKLAVETIAEKSGASQKMWGVCNSLLKHHVKVALDDNIGRSELANSRSTQRCEKQLN